MVCNMDNNFDNMYDTTELVDIKPTEPRSKIVKTGILCEVEISGQKFHTVDPVEFQKFENNINSLKHRLALTEQLIRQLQGQLRQRDQYIREIKRDLDTKVSHER